MERAVRSAWKTKALMGAIGVVVVLAGIGLTARERSRAEAAGPVSEVYVSSTDGLIRKVIVAGPTKGTATVVGKTPNSCADSLLFEPSGKLIVTGLCSAEIYRLDPAAAGGASNIGTPVNTSPLSGGAADPALNAGGTKVYVSSFSNAVDEVDLGTGAVVHHHLTGMTDSSGVAFDSSGDLWVTDYSAGSIGIANLTSNTYTPLCTGAPQSDGLAYDSSTGKLYVSGQSSNIIRQLTITSSTCSVSQSWEVTNHPDGIAPDGVGGVFAAGQNGTLIRLDTTNGSVDSIVSGIPSLDDIAPVVGFGAPGGPQPTAVPTQKAVATPCIGGIVSSRCPNNPPAVVATQAPAATATSVRPTAVAPKPTATTPTSQVLGIVRAPNTGGGPGESSLSLGWLLLVAASLLAGGAGASIAALRVRRR
jgi:hypothetical protein